MATCPNVPWPFSWVCLYQSLISCIVIYGKRVLGGGAQPEGIRFSYRLHFYARGISFIYKWHKSRNYIIVTCIAWKKIYFAIWKRKLVWGTLTKMAGGTWNNILQWSILLRVEVLFIKNNCKYMHIYLELSVWAFQYK